MHRPGEELQTDFTSGNELNVTVGGESFDHLICYPVLPYSNWEWVTVCKSESMAAIRRGVQAALFQLGRVPCVFHAIPITDSTGSRSPVPREADHRFHGKPISDSTGVDHPTDC